MRQSDGSLSAYRFMWLLVMFDLPVGTKLERRAATKFRLSLLDLGFEMSQFSVYMRFCVGKEQAAHRTREIANQVPPKGTVHILAVTDRQFEQMAVFRGRTKSHGNNAPSQLVLF